MATDEAEAGQLSRHLDRAAEIKRHCRSLEALMDARTGELAELRNPIEFKTIHLAQLLKKKIHTELTEVESRTVRLVTT